MRSFFLSFFSLISLWGCGQTSDEKIDDIILSTNIYLGKSDCSKAIETITSIPFEPKHAQYLRTYASSYACRGGYKTTSFFMNDVGLFGTPAIIGGAAKFSTSSSMDDPDNDDFDDIQLAIDTLLYAGGIDKAKNPTLARRAESFTTAEIQEINSLLMYLLMVQMGKYIHYYGNSDADGLKGQGTNINNNKCFVEYDDLAFDAAGSLYDYLSAANTGSCDDGGGDFTGHVKLGTGGSFNQDRMCQGVVILNNFIHIFPTVITYFSGSDFSSLSGQEANIALAKAAAVAAKASVSNVFDALSYDVCMDLSTDDIQIYFAFAFETLFK